MFFVLAMQTGIVMKVDGYKLLQAPFSNNNHICMTDVSDG